jgi:ATP-dependent exoDNAse (exonuclease V) alpha subunit
VDVVEGAAGSGKTFALAAAHDAWRASGFTVVGAILAARAARNLESSTEIPSSALHRLLATFRRPERGRLGPQHVVIIDEAAMVGTRKLLELVQHARSANAKIVLIGDPCQFPEIEAGGAFAALVRRERRTVLAVNRRQVEGWERQALLDMRSSRADDALSANIANDRMHHDNDPDALRERLVADWWESVVAKHRTVMLALHRHEVDELNRRARLQMRAADRLGDVEWKLGEELYSVGDTVLAHRNDHRERIVNGDRGQITAVDEDARRIEVALEDGSILRVPFEYAEAGHLTHGYATTIHKTQGTTIDAAIVLVHPSMSREQLYSAMSRGRLRNEMYVTGDEVRAEVAHVAEVHPEPEAVVRSIMQRSSAESLALDSLGVEL